MRRINRSAPQYWHIALVFAAGDAAQELRNLLKFLDENVGISASEFAEAGFAVPTDLAGTVDKNEEAPAAGDLSRTVTHRVASRPKNYAVARMRRSERVVLGWHSASSPWAGNMDGTLAPEEEAQIGEKLAHERHFDAILFFMFFFGYESSIKAAGWGKWYLLAAVAAASVGVTIWMDESCSGVNTPLFNATVCRAVNLSLYTNYTAAKFACENAAQLGRCNYVPDTSYLWAHYRRDLYMVLCAALSVPCFLALTFLDMWVRDGVRASPVGRSIVRTKKSLSNRLLPGVSALPARPPLLRRQSTNLIGDLLLWFPSGNDLHHCHPRLESRG